MTNLTNNIRNNFRGVADPNACLDLMETFLIDFLDVHCPIKTFRSKENTPPWVTHDILTLSKDKDRAWDRPSCLTLMRTGPLLDSLGIRPTMQLSKPNLIICKTSWKLTKKVPKKFWHNVRDILPEQSSGIINIKNPLNNETLPKDQQAQVVNNFFVNIGGNINAKFGPDVQLPAHCEPEGLKLKINHLGQHEVVKLIGTICVNKSSGMENVSGCVIKDYLLLISRELTMLYNNVLSSGSFPDKWKLATETPIPNLDI